MNADIFDLAAYRDARSNLLREIETKTREQLIDEFLASLVEQEELDRHLRKHRDWIKREVGDSA